MIASVVVLVAFAAPRAPEADPCAFDSRGTGEMIAAPNSAAATAYREVGDEERRAGHDETAAFAYREALRRSPRDARARSALAVLCADRRRRAATTKEVADASRRFDEGLRLMKSGNRSGAITAFESVRSSTGDRSAVLLEGICEYELGNDQRSRSLLLEAQAEPEIAGTALFFLGLIALRQGDGSGASALVASAAAIDTRLGADAADVLRLARRDGRFVLSAVTEGGVDSNVELTPDGTATSSGRADGYGTGAVAVLARPYGVFGPYLRVAGQYRQQLRITSYNLGDVSAAVGARGGRDRRYAVAEYAYDFLVLGQTAFLSAHKLLGAGRLAFGAFSVAGAYFARFESFLRAGTGGYSGLRHDGEAQIEWRPDRRVNLLFGYRVGRDATTDSALSYWEHGPSAAFRLNLDGPFRLGGEGRLTVRQYDTVDPPLAVERADRYLDCAILGEIDVSARWMVRLSTTARRALSNVADFQYTKVTGSIGLIYAAGVL